MLAEAQLDFSKTKLNNNLQVKKNNRSSRGGSLDCHDFPSNSLTESKSIPKVIECSTRHKARHKACSGLAHQCRLQQFHVCFEAVVSVCEGGGGRGHGVYAHAVVIVHGVAGRLVRNHGVAWG